MITLLGGTSTKTFSGTSPVYVYLAQLDPTTLAAGNTQTLRPGAAPVTLTLTDTSTVGTAAGTLGSSSIVFKPGDSMLQTTFQPANPGTAVIGFSGTLPGYATPTTDATTTFTVTAQ